MTLRRTIIADLFNLAPEGQDVSVKGWVRTRRGNKHVQFVALNDGSTIKNIQIVFDATLFPEETLKAVTTGSSLHVIGTLVESQGKGQSVEIQAKTFEIYGTADPEKYPLQKKGHTLEFLREIAHLRPRTNTFGAVLRVRSAMAQAIHKFFGERGFYYLNTPLITELRDILDGESTNFVNGRFLNYNITGLNAPLVGTLTGPNAEILNFNFQRPNIQFDDEASEPAGILANKMADGASVTNCTIRQGTMYHPGGPAGMIVGTIESTCRIKDCTVSGYLIAVDNFDPLAGSAPGNYTSENNNDTNVTENR